VTEEQSECVSGYVGEHGQCNDCGRLSCPMSARTDSERAVLAECKRLKIRRDPATDELVVDQSQLMRIFLAELKRRENDK
jgi:hypothetical protein